MATKKRPSAAETERQRREAALKRAIEQGAYNAFLASVFRRDILAEQALRGVSREAQLSFAREVDAPILMAVSSLLSGIRNPEEERLAQGDPADGPAPPQLLPPAPRMPRSLTAALDDIAGRGAPRTYEIISTAMEELSAQEVAFTSKAMVRAYGTDSLAPVALAQVSPIGGAEPSDEPMVPPAAAAESSRIVQRATSEPVFGKVVEDVWGQSLGQLKKKVEDEVGAALQRGATTDEIVRMLRGTRAKRFEDGLLPKWRTNNVRAFVRTVGTHVTTVTREASLAALGAPFVQWVSTLDLRTTPICIDLDLQVFPVGVGPRPPAHVQCRSTIVPWWSADAPEFGGKRASKDGPVPSTTSAAEWVSKLPQSELEEIVGVARAKALRDGTLTFKQLLDDQLRLRSVRDLRARGLLPATTPTRTPEPTMPPPARVTDPTPPTPSETAAQVRDRNRAARQPTRAINPQGQTTAERHTAGGDGKTWSPERVVLHEEIVEDALRGVPEVDSPTLYLMGGGPASGKSSLIRKGVVKHPAHVLANPDEFKADLPEYREGVAAKDSGIAAATHDESSYLNKRVMSEAASRNKNVVWDGTGDSTFENLKGRIDVFRKRGYSVRADYATISTEEALRREALRAASSGRQVPRSVVVSTHANVSKVFPEAVRKGLFDEVNLWDNSGTDPVLIASGRGTRLTVYDETRYAAFIAKANNTNL